MRTHLILISSCILLGAQPAAARAFGNDLLSQAEDILEPGALHHEKILSNQNTPEVGKVMRIQRELVKNNNLVPALSHQLATHLNHLGQPEAAGKFLFGLDILRSLDTTMYTANVIAAINSRWAAVLQVMAALISRGTAILVDDRFTLQQRVSFLRAVMGYRKAT